MTAGIALVSFSPSAGTGVYSSQDALHEFDLVAEDDRVLLQRSEHRAAPVVATFSSREDLLAFATQEYLRDKKHTYYSTILTQDIDTELQDEILEFLNEPDLVPLAMAETLVTALHDIGSPSRAWRCVRRATALQLHNVVRCLRTQFRTLLEPPWIIRRPAPPPTVLSRPTAALLRPDRPHLEKPHWVGFDALLPERDPDTESYVRALIAGDAAVREHFFIHFGKRLQRRVPPPLTFMAEDIVLDALLRTIESLERHGLRKPWHLTSFTQQVLWRAAVDAQRKEQRYVPLGEHLLAPADQVVEALLWQSAPPISEPLIPTDAEALLAEAMMRLNALEPRAASVLRLQLEGRTIIQIAERLGITPSAAHRQSALAKNWLREYLRRKPQKPR